MTEPGNPTLSEEEATELAREMAAQGIPPSDILHHLITHGVDRGIAHFIVTEKVDRVRTHAGRKHMVIGGLICVVGLAVTWYSYLYARDGGGGRYVVAYGAIIVGGIQFVRGLMMARQE